MTAALSGVVTKPSNSAMREIAAAGLGGGVGSVIDMAVLVLLVAYSRASIPLSAFLAAGSGAVVCFLWNKHIAFRDRSAVTVDQVLRFGLVAVATGILTALGMKLIAVDLGVHHVPARLLCAAVVFAIWTYPAQRRLVFRPAPVV
jgi:putative flippase GtrA